MENILIIFNVTFTSSMRDVRIVFFLLLGKHRKDYIGRHKCGVFPSPTYTKSWSIVKIFGMVSSLVSAVHL